MDRFDGIFTRDPLLTTPDLRLHFYTGPSMTWAAIFFWMVTGLKVMLSFPIQVRAAQIRSPENLSLAKSQRKDDWLGCAIMTIALVCDRYLSAGVLHIDAWLYLFGTIAMAWLTHRAIERRRFLQTE
jgi:hypothetical protein